MHTEIPPDQYYKGLARVPTSGGAIMRNEKGDFLIVKQCYKDDWGIAGGMSNEHETAREAVIREVYEELGLHVTDAQLFCVDFAIVQPFDRILFVFDCGILSEETIARIKIDNDEITDFQFVPYDKMIGLVTPKLKKRLANSIEALRNGTCIYLENGEVSKSTA